MSLINGLFKRAFGLPRGVLGKLGGRIMARLNADCGAWLVDLVHIEPTDSILEVGFGSGVIIQLLAKTAPAGRVAGIDLSEEMVAQASARNSQAIERGVVDLHHGPVDDLPFPDATFDKVLAINSMQVWPDPVCGLRELRRVMKPGAILAVGFTPYSGQQKSGLAQTLANAGFANPQLRERDDCFCLIGVKV